MKINSVTGLKKCPRCKNQFLDGKPASDFGMDAGRSDGLSYLCRECVRIRNSQWRKENRESAEASSIKWRKANPRRTMLKSCRERARRKCLPCTITEEDIYIPEYCPICTRQLAFKCGEKRYGPTPSSPSVDMYNPKLGYIPDNTWTICITCNSRKLDMSGEDHVAFGIQLINAFKEECERVAQLQAPRGISR